jgi:SOS response associated peptidase (SRAP)
MCGRYRLAREKEILAEVFDVGDDDNWSPRYNIAPSQSVPVVRQDATRPVRSFSLIRWGLIPFSAKDAKADYKMINARAETIAEKPAFREPLLSRRCLIPADGFYEWSKFSKGKSHSALPSPMTRSLRSPESGTDGRTPSESWSKPVRYLRLQQMHFCPTFMTECRSFSRVTTMSDGLIRNSNKSMTFSICSNRTNRIPCAAIA